MGDPILVGRLLVATPLLEDPGFRRSVVLLLDHGSTGALGVVVNRPTSVDVAEVLPPWRPFATAPGRVFQGGPVSPDSALGVVAVPGRAEGVDAVRRVSGSLALVDLDTPPDPVVPLLAGLRIFAGYAGWAAGQLEDEIEEGAWYVVDAEPRDAFTDRPERLWRDVLRRQRGDLALVSTYPEDVSLN